MSSIGLDPKRYGTHSMRRTKAAHIYKKTGNLRAVQLLLGHKKLESTVQYLGIEVLDNTRPALRYDAPAAGLLRRKFDWLQASEFACPYGAS